MMIKYPECSCEDYPCCGHYDILYGDEGMPEYCDTCGINHSGDCRYDDDDDDYDDATDDEDAISLRGAVICRWPGDRWEGGEDRHLDASYEDRFEGPYQDYDSDGGY